MLLLRPFRAAAGHKDRTECLSQAGLLGVPHQEFLHGGVT